MNRSTVKGWVGAGLVSVLLVKRSTCSARAPFSHCSNSTAIMTGATAVIEAQGSTAPPGRGAGASPVSDYDTTGATDKTTTMPDIASVHAPDKPASMFRAKLLYVPQCVLLFPRKLCSQIPISAARPSFRYFVFCATNGTLYPFLVLWFEHIGLDAEVRHHATAHVNTTNTPHAPRPQTTNSTLASCALHTPS